MNRRILLMPVAHRFLLLLGAGLVLMTICATVRAQDRRSPSSPAENVEQVTEEATRIPQSPLSTVDRPVYRALKEWKNELVSKYGISWALEDTLIYQHTSGGIDPDDALVNTLGLFATWKVLREADGKDFAGLGFQFETRGNPMDDEFRDLVADLGTLWSPNDSTSDAYDKINQLWWGQRFADGRGGLIVGKIDPGAHINANRFAGSGNTQFFSQPFATNPARSFPDNGLGIILRAEPADWFHLQYVMSDGDAVSTYSPFKTIEGRWFHGGEMVLKPMIHGLGQGNYRLLLYHRDAEAGDELGWSFSADQNLSEKYGVFLRYGGNDAELNAIEHLVSAGFAWLAPFGRRSDQAGLGVSWTRPADDDLRDEYSCESYYRMRLTEGVELSVSAQLVVDPSAGNHDDVAVFGLRLRFLY